MQLEHMGVIAAGQHLGAFFKHGKGGLHGRPVSPPLFGQLEPAHPAHKQRAAQRVLQALDLLADGRLAHVQLLGRIGEAQRPGSRVKYTQPIQWRQSGHG